MRKLLAVGVVCLAAVCIVPAQPGDARAVIEANSAKFSRYVAGGNAAGVASLYADDAQVFPPGAQIVSGRQGIQKFWQDTMSAGMKQAALKVVEVESQGNLAVEVGTYVLKGADGKQTDQGKYVAVWKKVGNDWMLYRDIWNSSPSVPSAPSGLNISVR